MAFLEKGIPTNIFPERKLISNEFKKGVINGDMSKFGIEIIMPVYLLPRNECCFNYVFREQNNFKDFWNNFYLTTRYCEQKANAIVVYFEKNILDFKNIKHVGIVDKNVDDVISRWGQGGHLYRHKYWKVPEIYGDRITFIENIYG